MPREKKKGERGEAITYYTRTQAMRKLQISMPEFRRLCILKGIHPQEPKHKKKVNNGSSAYKTYYFRKDIQWLAHEPLLRKGQEFKIFLKKLKRALEKDDQVKMASVEEHRPRYTLDHVVRERYPSFVDALRDIDDALTMIFLYSAMASKKVKSVVVHNCRRIAVEFMHYVITSRAIRKVFLSIKGIYYQVEIDGQCITWLTPYNFPQRMPKDVDFRVMSTFVEFYSTLLGFINYRLYNALNLRYPPQISGLIASPETTQTPTMLVDPRDLEWDHSEHREMLESLSHSLARVITNQTEDDAEIDEDIPLDLTPEEQTERDKAKKEAEETEKFKKLFEGCQFFISRETPRESLTFIIRSFGGVVSCDSSDAVGATYVESDDSITHQIVDRPDQRHRYLSRVYIQPQWIYDSVNFRRLLPTSNYAPGGVLPPHLSPFVVEKEGDYVTPDKAAILEAFGDEEVENKEQVQEKQDDDEPSIGNATKYFEEILSIMGGDEADNVQENEDKERDEKESANEEDLTPLRKKRKVETTGASMRVIGSVVAGDGDEGGEDDVKKREIMAEKDLREEKKLAIMMLTGRRRKLYDRIMKNKNKKARRVKQLHMKRKDYEAKRTIASN